jgi:hypothetical protein
MIAGMPPTALAKIGVPLAMASSRARGRPSVSDGIRKTSNIDRNARESLLNPMSLTEPERFSAAIHASNSALSGPSPAMTSLQLPT